MATRESVLTRAVLIFETFTPDRPVLTVSEISRRTGLHLATVSRLVAELVRHGLLARDADRGVRVGVRMWELASRASPALSLRELAMPFLEDAHAVVGHHVQLGVLDGTEVIFLERLSAEIAVVNYTRIAGRLPLHVSSCGLVLLAFGPVALQESVLGGALPRYTAHTISTESALRAKLADIRHRGYAWCPGFVHPEALGVAVPIRGQQGSVVAALSAIVPNDTQGRDTVAVLHAAARGIGRRLAGPPLIE